MGAAEPIKMGALTPHLLQLTLVAAVLAGAVLSEQSPVPENTETVISEGFTDQSPEAILSEDSADSESFEASKAEQSKQEAVAEVLRMDFLKLQAMQKKGIKENGATSSQA